METTFGNVSDSVAASSGAQSAMIVAGERPKDEQLMQTILSTTLNGNFGLRLDKQRVVFIVHAIPPPSHVQQGQGHFYRITRTSPLLYAAATSTVVKAKLCPSRNTILIWHMDNWVDGAAWAMSTFPRSNGDVFGIGSPLWYNVYLWNTSGKPFKFLKLSAELRNKIYDACADFTYPYYWVRNEGERHLSTVSLKKQLQSQAPIMGLLLCNKQVSRGFRHEMFRNLQLRFMDTYLFAEFANQERIVTTSRIWPPLLSRVSLEFSVPQWAKRLNIGLPTIAGAGTCTQFCKLLDQLQISHLSLDIPHIGDLDYGTMFEPTDAGCHRVFLGMILLHLQQCHIKRIPHVEVNGCVPEDMKTTFRRLHDDELIQGGVSTVTEWDLIGNSTKLRSEGISWHEYLSNFLRPRRSVCSVLNGGEEHGCEKLFCNDDFCLSKTALRRPN